jgi:hypothetical protein
MTWTKRGFSAAAVPFWAALFLVGAAAVGDTRTWYVDDDAPAGGNGFGWETAFNDLQAAFDEAASAPADDHVFKVAQGIYVPTKPFDQVGEDVRTVSFEIGNNWVVFGGYGGITTGDPDAREPEIYVSQLSGADIRDIDPVDCPSPDCDTCGQAASCFTGHPTPGCADIACCTRVCSVDPYCCAPGNGWDQTCVNRAKELCPTSLHAYHVVAGVSLDETVRLDGFTITGGIADGNLRDNPIDDQLHGGGIFLSWPGAVPGAPSPFIAQCKIISNVAIHGGGLSIEAEGDSDVSPLIANCLLEANQARSSGGGAWSDIKSQEVWVNSIFSGNWAGFYSASPGAGGGMFALHGTSGGITNCVFWANRAADGGAGGGLYVVESGDAVQTSIQNCIFHENSVGYDFLAGIDADAQIHVDVNFARDVTVDYSDVPAGLTGDINDGGNNIGDDPRFVDPQGRDFRLLLCSLCIDTGNPNGTVIPRDVFNIDGDEDFLEPMPDLDLDDRILDGRLGGPAGVDMGAYEFVPLACPMDCADDGDGVVDVEDFLALLAQWGEECTSCDQRDEPGVGVLEFLRMLEYWGPCPEGGGRIPQTVQECIDKIGLEEPLVLAACICTVEPEACEE